MFTCETVGGALSWVVNGTQRELIDPEMRRDLMISEETVNDGGRTEQSLTIPARAEYNGTRVQCLVFSLSGSDQSENATMIIQGIFIPDCSYAISAYNIITCRGRPIVMQKPPLPQHSPYTLSLHVVLPVIATSNTVCVVQVLHQLLLI